jgi:hypothetical protein
VAVAVSLTVLVVRTPGRAKAPAPQPHQAGLVWLCEPGMANDPCTGSTTTRVIPATGRSSLAPTPVGTTPGVDCFFLYGTVSEESSVNANLAVQSAERVDAQESVARFAPLCRIYAPVYPELTIQAIDHPSEVTKAAVNKAYDTVRADWKYYLRYDNDGRGVVFIGHSQGALMLVHLLATEVDPEPKVRRLLVSAILPGANVTVPIEQIVGGAFHHIPACARIRQIGCVISFSSFESMPPTNAYFGRVNTFIARFSDTSTGALLQTLCVNPADLSGSGGVLLPYLPTGLSSSGRPRWDLYPYLYRAHCVEGGGASWLDVVPTPSRDDHRPLVSSTLGPRYGLEPDDLALAVGNLVAIVTAQSAAYLAR